MREQDSKAIDKLIEMLKKEEVEAKPLPVAIYARKSTKDETQISIQSQIDACKKYLEGDNRVIIDRVYSDENKSGYTTTSRKEYQKMINEVKIGTIKVIIAYSLDRTSRNILDDAKLINDTQKYGAIVLYATQSYEDNARGHLMRNVEMSLAQFTPEDVSERSILAGIKTAKSCKATGGVAPYGFRVINGKYIINDEEAPAIKIMFNDACAGKTIPSIIDDLTKAGYKARSGKVFSTNSIWTILKNEKYTGVLIYNKANGRLRKNRVAKGRNDEIRIDGGMPQIISNETFQKAQIMLSKKTTKSSPRAKHNYALTGLLICGCCGKRMHGDSSGGKSNATYYCCDTINKCHTSLRKDTIERATASITLKVIQEICDDKVALSKAFEKTKISLKTELASINTRITAKERERKNTIKSLGNTTIKEVQDIISKEIVEINNDINSMKNRKDCLKETLNSYNSFIDKAQSNGVEITVDDMLKNDEMLNRLFKLTIKDIKITKDNVVFNLNDFTI